MKERLRNTKRKRDSKDRGSQGSVMRESERETLRE